MWKSSLDLDLDRALCRDSTCVWKCGLDLDSDDKKVLQLPMEADGLHIGCSWTIRSTKHWYNWSLLPSPTTPV